METQPPKPPKKTISSIQPYEIKLLATKNVVRAKYLNEEKILELEFKSGGIYHYFNFEPSEWSIALQNEKDFDRYFFKVVRSIYGYRRIS